MRMSKSFVGISYALSLLWIVLFISVTVAALLIGGLVVSDLIHTNPHRTMGNVVIMMVMETPLICVIAIIGCFLVFTVPQFFQAAMIVALNPIFGSRARFVVLLALPLTAVLTWYCYDYLTPSDLNSGINVRPDWAPYEHGISSSRYLRTLVIQAPITLFSFLYFEAEFHRRSRKPVLVAGLTLAVMIGGIWGYGMAQDQIRLR
jgi:hypothetical protein